MKEIADAHSDAEISRLDGVSVDYPDWHFNVRPSNTEPLLRLNLESLVSREDMEAEARRGPGADPLVTARGRRSRERRAAGIQPPADPDPVRGRAGQLLPDRGRAADPVDTGPNSGKALDELERQLATSATRSRTSSW